MSVHDEVKEATVRRIITGYRKDGLAVVLEDEIVSGAALAEVPDRTDAKFFHVWATAEMPVSLDDEALVTQRKGSQDDDRW